jgi:hypothetical protein
MRSDPHGLRRGLQDIARFAGYQATSEVILAARANCASPHEDAFNGFELRWAF